MKHVGVLESNTSGSGFDGLRAAKELGCRVTFFTNGIERYLAVPGGRRYIEECVDEIVSGPTHEFDWLLDRVRAYHRTDPLGGFFSLAEYEVVDAALIARDLGLPGPDPEAVRTARNKIAMRRHCAPFGVPMPRFAVVSDPAQALAAVRQVGLPCVVKPADETSSADVRRCATVEEAADQIHAILAQPLNIRGQARHPEVLVEQYLSGIEVSVEVLATDRAAHVLGVTDKWVGGVDRFVELGHAFPSLLPDGVRRGCEDVAVAAVRALGLRMGLLHVEVKHTPDGPRLIEVNPRPAGDKIHELVDLSLGGSCLELVVRQYLGERVDDLLPRGARRGAAIRFLTAPAGQVTTVAGTELAASLPGVLSAVVSVAPGDPVHVLTRNEDRVGHVLAVADDPYLAARTADAAVAEISVRTVPQQPTAQDGA